MIERARSRARGEDERGGVGEDRRAVERCACADGRVDALDPEDGARRARGACDVAARGPRPARAARRTAALAALAFALVASPTSASASNQLHPRTPVIFAPSACLTVVDRAVDPLLEIHYAIPFEDVDVGADEVDGSRRHQFLALCRDHPPAAALPPWIAAADVAAAAANDPPLVDPEALGDDDVLDTSPAWAGCAARITADDARRPITEAAASEPVPWDTSSLAAGPWRIFGYTWEPALNLWVGRAGVVKVIDGDADAAPPALAIANWPDFVAVGEVGPVDGCVDAVAGAQISASWSRSPPSPPLWVPFVVDQPIAGDAFAVEFAPTAELAGESVMIRVDLVDPQGRTATAYAAGYVAVYEPAGSTGDETTSTSGSASAGESSGAAESTTAGTTEGPTSSAGPSTGEASSSGEGATTGAPGGDPGCACATGPRDGPGGSHGPFGWVVVVLWRKRQVQRDRSEETASKSPAAPSRTRPDRRDRSDETPPYSCRGGGGTKPWTT